MIDERATMDIDALVERVARKIIALLEDDTELRKLALRIREAKLAELRAFEDMYGLPRSVATWAERRNEQAAERGMEHANTRRGGGHFKE